MSWLRLPHECLFPEFRKSQFCKLEKKRHRSLADYLKFWLEAQIKEKPIPYSSLSNSVGARGIHEDSLMSVQY